ncbi:MAG: 16S rRNA methyltransferase [Chloroflexota bacterium]
MSDHTSSTTPIHIHPPDPRPISVASPLEQLVAAVLASPKYCTISPALVERIGRQELAVRPGWKEAVKATKNRLHQVGGAYFQTRPDYEKALARLREAAGGGMEGLRPVCQEVMRWHTSTRERLPFLEQFYAETIGTLPDLHSVIDIACGLNPLALPWMPFANTQNPQPSSALHPPSSVSAPLTYYAYDIYSDLVAFLNGFLALARVEGRAEVRDVVGHPPDRPADLALLLKTLPCLEQLEKGAAGRLLEAVQARYLLVSFPARSLGGRPKGMVENYEAWFLDLIEGKGWRVERFEFPTELAFLVQKGE